MGRKREASTEVVKGQRRSSSGAWERRRTGKGTKMLVRAALGDGEAENGSLTLCH